jgi:iron complex outermembrane receptor protein
LIIGGESHPVSKLSITKKLSVSVRFYSFEIVNIARSKHMTNKLAKNNYKKLLSTACIPVIVCLPLNAAAQENDTEKTKGVEIIEVTAQRVGESIQDVPISITAISGDVLRTRQIDSFDQLQFVAPGITFNSGINARQSATTIRGIGTGLFNIGIEASVAIVIDDVTMGREGAGIFDFADVERVEILRGPQGTLFGKNASAGVVSIITKGPTDDFQSSLNASYGSFNEINLNAGLSGPISDSVSYRLSAYTNTRDGYINNVNPNNLQDNLNERDEQGIRGKLKIELSDDADLLLSADHVTREQASGVLTYRAVSPGGPGSGLLGTGVQLAGPISAGIGIIPGPTNRDIGSEGIFISDTDAFGVSALYSQNFGEYKFESISAYREWNSFDNNDADLIPLPLLAVNEGDLEQSQFSQEFRLHSPRNQRLSYTIGALYFEQELNQSNIQSGTAGLDLLGVIPPGLLLGTDLTSSIEETNIAIFGQSEYVVNDELVLIAGLRLLNSDLKGSQQRAVAAGSIGPFAGQSASSGPESAEDQDSAVAWRLGAKYIISDKVNLFATVSRGYKAAGIVTGLTISPDVNGTLPVVRPEVPTQLEIGIRTVSEDGGLVANLTTFYMNVDDFQAQTLVPGEDGTSIFAVANAGKVKSYGAEVDITAYFDVGITASLAGAYTKAEFDEFDGAPCYSLQTAEQGCLTVGNIRAQNLEGGRLSNSPEWVVNALGRYDFEVGSHFAFAQLGLQYRSSILSSITNDPNTIEDNVTLLDAQIGFDFWSSRASLALFGRNLTNNNFAEAIVGMVFDTGGYAQFNTLESERTWGLRLSYEY